MSETPCICPETPCALHGNRPTLSLVGTGGWCAPSPLLYDLARVPPIRRGSITPAPPPSLRDRLSAVRSAVAAAWKYPDGYWEAD